MSRLELMDIVEESALDLGDVGVGKHGGAEGETGIEMIAAGSKGKHEGRGGASGNRAEIIDGTRIRLLWPDRVQIHVRNAAP